jgi:hypothetical protein
MNELSGLIMSRVINILMKHDVGKFFKNLKLQNAIILNVNDMEKIIAYTSNYSLRVSIKSKIMLDDVLIGDVMKWETICSLAR